MNASTDHPSPEQIQAFLEGEAPSRERSWIERHFEGCPGCRDQAEAWQAVLSELNRLPVLSPSANFARGVLDRLELREPSAQAVPLGDRMRTWWGAVKRRRIPAGGHPAPELLQDWADAGLPRRLTRRIDRHLDDCSGCAGEARAWMDLVLAMEELPRLQPSDDFADGVLARVRTSSSRATEAREPAAEVAGPAPVRAPSPAVPDWLRSLRPRSGRGWLVAGGAIAAPGMALAAVAAFLVAHPLLSVGDVVAYGWWQASAFVSSLSGQLLSALVESVAVFRAYSFAANVLSAPLQSAAVILMLSGLTLWSAWVLYRNLRSPTATVSGSYAHSS